MSKTSPKGKSGWSQLREARGFKGAEENKKYSQDLILTKEVGEKFVAELQEEANNLHAQALEKARMSGKNVRYAPPMINYKDLPDGSIQLSFKRKEEDGAPFVLDAHKKPYSGIIGRDHSLEIAYEMKPYVLATVFGVTLKLIAVRVLEVGESLESVADLFGDSPKAETTKQTSIDDLF